MQRDSTMTPLELYGHKKINAVRDLRAAHELDLPEGKLGLKNPDARFFKCVLNALQCGTFTQQMKLYSAFPEFVEAYDEYSQTDDLTRMWAKYGI